MYILVNGERKRSRPRNFYLMYQVVERSQAYRAFSGRSFLIMQCLHKGRKALWKTGSSVGRV